MTDHLGPVSVPDPGKLPAVQRLGDLVEPYGPFDDRLFTAAMNEITAWHAERSEFYGRLWRAAGSPVLAEAADAPDLPEIHANFFKRHEVLSIPREQVFLHLTSSGTTGQKSQIFFDEWTIRAAQRMVAQIFASLGWITPDRPANYLLLSYEPVPDLRLGTSFTDNYLCDFAPTASVFHALRHTGSGHEFDGFGCVEALRRFAASSEPVRIFGFPSFLHFILERMREPLRLPEGSLVLLGGGWKGFANQQVPKEQLYERIQELLGIPAERIRDSFGSVEHCIPYTECSHHSLHVPVWSRVFIRGLRDLDVLPYGEQGYLHLVSPYITSVPAHSVLMGDLASLHPGAACPCDLDADWFTIHGRAGVGSNRSCAVAAAELLKA